MSRGQERYIIGCVDAGTEQMEAILEAAKQETEGGSNTKGLIDGAPEPEVQNFIERFRKKYPGREYKSGHKFQHSDGRFIEIDFEIDNVILEFKRGELS